MELQEFVRNHNDFGLQILKQLHPKGINNSENVFFSPLSIYLMLGLLASGASRKGETLEDLLSLLKVKSIDGLNSFVSHIIAINFGDDPPPDGYSSPTYDSDDYDSPPSEDESGLAPERPSVTSATGVWINQIYPVKPSFQKVLETVYNGRLNRVDFQNKLHEIKDEANSWVEKETRGLIKRLQISNLIDETTIMILVNALYFKGSWASPFDKRFTKDREFYLLNGNSVTVPFMSENSLQRCSVFPDFKVSSIRYKSGFKREFSMYIFLPDAHDGLPSLMEKFYSEPGFLDSHITRQSMDVDKFRIPKFKFSDKFEATEILSELGLSSLFLEGGFSEIVEYGGEHITVSNIFHQAVISVDEKGTEAAAVTECGMFGCCLFEPQKVDFIADHPFLFVIRENKTGTALFIGQVLDPSL